MILLTQLHLATPYGRVSPFVLMGINLKAKFLHGWILTTISGFIIHTNLFITSSQTHISRMGLTMHLIKSTISTEFITIITLCVKMLRVSALHYSAGGRVSEGFRTVASARALCQPTSCGSKYFYNQCPRVRNLIGTERSLNRSEHRVKREAS